jgi:hypothetical protein
MARLWTEDGALKLGKDVAGNDGFELFSIAPVLSTMENESRGMKAEVALMDKDGALHAW